MKKVSILTSLLLVVCMFFATLVFAGPVGVYTVTEKTPMGAQKATIAINADGTGYVLNMMGKSEFTEAKISDNDFTFTMNANTPKGKMKIAYKGTVNGDEISGSSAGPMGPIDFAGKRKK